MTSLYEQLGGAAAIEAAVEIFYRKMLGDPRVAPFFDGVDMDRQMAKQAAFLTMVTGGPHNYTGRDMRTSHAGMRITETEFNALVADLVKSLDKFKVGAQEQQELLAALGGMKADIVDA